MRTPSAAFRIRSFLECHANSSPDQGGKQNMGPPSVRTRENQLQEWTACAFRIADESACKRGHLAGSGRGGPGKFVHTLPLGKGMEDVCGLRKWRARVPQSVAAVPLGRRQREYLRHIRW